ncbi:hypothetical protein [Streptomyces sp. NPDC048340]|uniref:hypothetical protein n=1 Tax=Streptomyces sp. NPDC048340 TaxID=3365537 RepID=UPI003714DD0D
MKFKHIAVMAAAAVVGPTVLMATPAMADEVKNPSATTPDAAPQGDTGQQLPQGPGLTLANLPSAGFAAGGDWSEFSLKVDNSGFPSVDDFALELGVTGSNLKDSHFDVEVFRSGSWHNAAPMPKPGPAAPLYDLTPGLGYGAGSVTDLKVRMRAKAEAPATDIKIHVRGTDHRDTDSKAAPYASKVTHDQTGGGGGVTASVPKLTLGGLPESGFTAGSDWREFSLHVDNSNRGAINNYSLEMAMWTLDTTGFKDGDAKLGVYAPDASGSWGWHDVEAYGSEEAWSFSLAEVDIERNEVFDLKLRMKFAKGAPATRLSLDTTAEGGSAPRVKHSTVLTAADQEARQGPKLGLDGLPQGGFVAGGDWQELALHVDNSGKEAIDTYSFFFFLFPNGPINGMKAEHFDIELWNGTAWVPFEQDRGEWDDVPSAFFDWAVGKNARFDIQLRVRAAADAPNNQIHLILYAHTEGAQLPVESDMVVKSTSVRTANTGGGTGTDNGTGNGGNHNSGGNQPTPDGGAKPVGTGGNAAAPAGGQLATTGADPATSWALGASGVALAMGAALVAGTGRRRRPTA